MNMQATIPEPGTQLPCTVWENEYFRVIYDETGWLQVSCDTKTPGVGHVGAGGMNVATLRVIFGALLGIPLQVGYVTKAYAAGAK